MRSVARYKITLAFTQPLNGKLVTFNIIEETVQCSCRIGMGLPCLDCRVYQYLRCGLGECHTFFFVEGRLICGERLEDETTTVKQHLFLMNIEPLKSFLEKEMQPDQVSALLDEILFEYIETMVVQQLSGNNERGLHSDTLRFIYMLRRLRDVFAECQSV